MTPTTALTDALAAYRLVRLVQRDRLPVLARWRGALAAAADRSSTPALRELLDCAWCAGVHVSALVWFARRAAPGVWGPFASVLASSTIVGFLAAAEDAADPDGVEFAGDTPDVWGLPLGPGGER